MLLFFLSSCLSLLRPCNLGLARVHSFAKPDKAMGLFSATLGWLDEGWPKDGRSQPLRVAAGQRSRLYAMLWMTQAALYASVISGERLVGSRQGAPTHIC